MTSEPESGEITGGVIVFTDPKVECDKKDCTPEEKLRTPYFTFQTEDSDLAGKEITVV